MISMNHRSKIAAVSFVCKCIQGKIVSNISEIIIQRRITRTITRNPRYFDVDNLPVGGPIHRMLSIANELREEYNLEDGINTTKAKLNAFFRDTLDV